MSMPVISMHCNPITMCQAVTDLIESIALEETALPLLGTIHHQTNTFDG